MTRRSVVTGVSNKAPVSAVLTRMDVSGYVRIDPQSRDAKGSPGGSVRERMVTAAWAALGCLFAALGLVLAVLMFVYAMTTLGGRP